MTPEIRVAAPEERLQALSPIWHYFGSTPTEERATRVLDVLPEDRLHAAFEDGRVVGSAGGYHLGFTVPGGPVPVAGVTVVGVLPTHRRRGILRALMRAQLDDVHERGEALAVLWASEGGIYGRFGYGLSFLCGDMELARSRAAFARPVERTGSLRLARPDEAVPLLREVYDRVAAETPGMIARTEAWWRARIVHDPEWVRDGGGELNAAVLEEDGRPAAYALYRAKVSFADGASTGVTQVAEAMGATPAATAQIWRFLLDVDWMARVEAELLPLDHPLLLLLAEPAALRMRVGDGLWVRLVDVGAALAARAYAGDGDLVLEVSDPFCPWNEARFGLDGGKTMRDPDLRLDVDALGSGYLGGFSFSQLARAGRVEELARGALARADALFRSERAPWCPEIF
ncbi:MAG TPA: GNAT family N-acetyltransferase [Gaiellaceae bacterium]|nr:GNAT family N-acetyltransferase [Gaiellaceae bacterium]